MLRRTKDGKRIKEVVDGKKVTQYDEVEKTVKKDQPSRLHARRQMLKVLYPVVEVPTDAAGKKAATKKVDLTAKLFDEYAASMLAARVVTHVSLRLASVVVTVL